MLRYCNKETGRGLCISRGSLGGLKPQSHYSDNQSPTSRSRQTISNYPATNFQPKMLVLNRSPTVCRPIADCLPSGRQPIANYSPTDYRTYFTFWNLISNHLESNRRLVADCLAWRDLHNLDHTWTVSWIHVGISFEMRVIQFVGGHPNRHITRFSVKFSIWDFSIISIVDIPLNILWNYQFLIWCNFCVIITFIESCYFLLS